MCQIFDYPDESLFEFKLEPTFESKTNKKVAFDINFRISKLFFVKSDSKTKNGLIKFSL